jgi:O-antigen ligase
MHKVQKTHAVAMEDSHKDQKMHYGLPFYLICALMIFRYAKPEFLIPGLSSVFIVRQVPNLLVGFLFLIWLLEGEKKLSNIQTKYFLALVILLGVSGALARNPGYGLSVFKSYIISLMLYVSLITFIDNYKKLSIVISIFIFCNILIGFLGINDGGLVRSVPALADENDFSLLMNILIPFAYFRAIENKNKKKKIFYYGLMFLFVSAVVVSFSRGGFVGLVAVLLYCFIKSTKKLKLTLAAIIITVSAMPFIPNAYIDEIRTIQQGTEESTASSRIYLWTVSLKMFADHPIIGVGPLNSGIWMTHYDRTEKGQYNWGRALHSVYFTLLSELGLAGLFIYLLLFFTCQRDKRFVIELDRDKHKIVSDGNVSPEKTTPLFRQLTDSRLLAYSLTGGLIGYLVSGIFLSVLYYRWFEMLMTYTVILYNITVSAEKELNKLRSEAVR